MSPPRDPLDEGGDPLDDILAMTADDPLADAMGGDPMEAGEDGEEDGQDDDGSSSSDEDVSETSLFTALVPVRAASDLLMASFIAHGTDTKGDLPKKPPTAARASAA